MMDQVLQLLGAILILTAFILTQMGRLDPRAHSYLTLNLVGSLLLAVLAALDYQWGFLLLEAVWAAVSLWAIIARVRGRRR